MWSRERSEGRSGRRRVAEPEMPFVHIGAERSTGCETALLASCAFFFTKVVFSHRDQDMRNPHFTICYLMASIQPRAYLFW